MEAKFVVESTLNHILASKLQLYEEQDGNIKGLDSMGRIT